ncbi:methyltransferase [Actinomadura meridiana]|uniref:Methyltransferase n=1 Tax=Actinomadura meridiana TaxID=559626 RepID=A0ABP8BUF5_9ACTN
MKIPEDVLAVLADQRTVIDGNRVRIGLELERDLYQRVDKILKEAGGKWDGRKKVRAHVFRHNVEDLMHHAILAGEFVSARDLGWFPTPPAVVEEMLRHASVSENRPGLTVLEPSAGTGAIAGPASARGAMVDCVELDEHRAAALTERCRPNRVVCGDFLRLDPLDYQQGFQRVLMNPPFKDALTHVDHAIGFLGDDALLVSVLPESVIWRSDRAHTEFRQLVETSGGTFVSLPTDAFESVGTRVRTVLAVLPTGELGALRTHSWHRSRPRQAFLFDL